MPSIREVSTVPNTAMPSAYPSCRKVLTAPPAIPARSAGTADSAAPAIPGETRPVPTPTSSSPGTRADAVEPASRNAMQNCPAAISSSPPPMVSRAGTPCSSRPPAAATTNDASDSHTNTRPPRTGLIPSSVCSHTEVYAITPNAAALKASAPSITPENAGRRNNRGSSSGSATRHSTTTKAPSATTASTKAADVPRSVQPCDPARTAPYVSAAANAAKAAVPARSTRRPAAPRDSGTTRSVSQIATTLTGRFTQKIHRQPGPSVSSPPSTGPTAAAAPLTAPHTPSAIDLWRPR